MSTPNEGYGQQGASNPGGTEYGETPTYSAPGGGTPNYSAPAGGTPAYGEPVGGNPAYGDPAAGMAPPVKPRNGAGVAALVFGILALVLCWFPVLGAILAIVAIITGAIGRGRAKRREATNGGMAMGGLVLGVLSLIINIVVIVLVVIGGTFFFNFGGSQTVQQFQQCLENAQNQPSPAAVQQAADQCRQQFQSQLPGGGQ